MVLPPNPSVGSKAWGLVNSLCLSHAIGALRSKDCPTPFVAESWPSHGHPAVTQRLRAPRAVFGVQLSGTSHALADCMRATESPTQEGLRWTDEQTPDARVTDPPGAPESADFPAGAVAFHGPPSDTTRLGRVLAQAIAAVEEQGIPYVLIGGIASSGLGRPRTTKDIDLFVKPEDARRSLAALAARGFHTEETDGRWIFKAFREDIQVDVIFNTVGGIYLDREMLARAVTGSFHGHLARFVPPEDLVVIKALVHDESTPRHWYDALGILTAVEIDWDYLLQRSRRAQRRVLSLLLYAQSVDIGIPNRVIRALYQRIYNS